MRILSTRDTVTKEGRKIRHEYGINGDIIHHRTKNSWCNESTDVQTSTEIFCFFTIVANIKAVHLIISV